MADNNIIGIANDRARNIIYYVVFDPNSMNTSIIRLDITLAQFEFKTIMFQMLQAIGQYSAAVNMNPHLHLRQFLEVANKFKIHGIIDDTFRLRIFTHSLRDKAKRWLNSLEPNSIAIWNDLAGFFLLRTFLL